MKKTLLTAILACSGFTALAQVVNIPDPIFEQLLIDKDIDTDGTVNGQISTADALATTTLTITYEDNNDLQFITDLTGIEAFTNLEHLTINFTEIEELNVSTLVKLKHLNCVDNWLGSLDVSNNPLLEYVNISTGGDVGPLNYISELDLSNNPNIKTVLAAGGIGYINLKNGNNNPDMLITISAFYEGMGPEPNIYTCIEVDDAEAAQSNALPYSEWTINHQYATYALVDDCSLNSQKFNKNTVSVFPNPASDVLNIQVSNGMTADNATLFDISGRLVKEYNSITDGQVSVSGLQPGTYILKLVSGKETFTQKVIKQ